MPSRFSSNTDYSQTFQHLVEQNQRSLESSAQSLDAERAAEWAARDALVFTKWTEGKISGNELLAHINKRISQSRYDKTERLKWQELAIQYGDVIADEQAEAAYAETDDLNALIAHYTKRLAAAKPGTPERRELAERLKSLREKRESKRVSNQARRIQRAIDRGEMGTKDMLDFYKAQLGEVKDPELRAEIKDNIARLQGKLRQERFETAMNSVDLKLEAGKISPSEAADAKAAILKKNGMEARDPVAYGEWQQHLQQLRATPDPIEIEKLESLLLNDQITPEEYSARLRQFADQIAPFNLQAAWDLRQEAQNFINEYATPLESDSLLGMDRESVQRSDGTYSGPIEVVRKLRGNSIKHITQFDGGQYNSTNCGMAAGAMVAHMMGYQGITGSDLRSLSGDTEGGTNVWQAMGAMTSNQIGIPADQLDARSNWTFEEFKRRVSEGAPAVLSGWTGDLPPELNSTSGIMGHGVAIAGYDAKRDAFLVLDPSGRGNQAKAWWPAEVVRSFAWGGQGGFNGIAMVGPANTIDPKTLQRTSSKIRHIDVTAPPERFPDAPRIENAMEPGPQVRQQVANDSLTRLQRQRLKDAGIIPGKDLDTKQEVSQLLSERDADINAIRQTVDDWVELSQMPGAYDEATGTVEIISTGQRLSADEIAALQKRLIYLLDGQQILYRANDEPEKAKDMQTAKREIVTEAAIVNTIEAEYATQQIIREARTSFADLANAKNPDERRVVANDIMDSLGEIAVIWDAQDEGEEGTSTEDQTDAQRKADLVDEAVSPNEWGTLVDTIGKVADAESAEAAVQELMNVLPELSIYDENIEYIQQVASLAGEQKAIETDEARYVLVGGQLHVATYDEIEVTDPYTGQAYTDRVLDISNLPEEVQKAMSAQGISVDDLSPIMLPDPQGGEAIDAIPLYAEYGNIDFAVGTGEGMPKSQLDDLEIPDDVRDAIRDGLTLDPEMLDSLSKKQIEALEIGGSIRRDPFKALAVRHDNRVWWGVEGEDGITTWSEGSIPFVKTGLNNEDDWLVNKNGFVGRDPDITHRVWPELDYEETSGTTGTLLMAADGVQPATYNAKAEELRVEGRFPSIVNVRNPIAPDEYIEMPVENFLVRNNIKPMIEAVSEARAQVDARDDAMVKTMGPDEAAEYNHWSFTEKQEYADEMGWDMEERSFGPSETGEEPTKNVMSTLGIKTAPEGESAQEVHDPSYLAKKQAMGVRKANAAERKAKAAAAEAERKAAASAAASAKLPPVTTKPPKAPVVPSPYRKPPTSPSPSTPPSTSTGSPSRPRSPFLPPEAPASPRGSSNPLAQDVDPNKARYGY